MRFADADQGLHLTVTVVNAFDLRFVDLPFLSAVPRLTVLDRVPLIVAMIDTAPSPTTDGHRRHESANRLWRPLLRRAQTHDLVFQRLGQCHAASITATTVPADTHLCHALLLA